MNRKTLIAGLTGTAVALATAIAGPAQVAHADDVRNYTVDFTNGWGVRLRQAPQIDAAGFGADGKLAVPEGYSFPAECEDYGDEVTNEHGETTDLWMRAPGGVWVSTAYLNTGTNSRVGLPLCSEKDAALQSSVKTKTVADYHREGQGRVMVVDRDGIKSRVYFSKSETQRAADAMNSAGRQSDFVNSAFCMAMGGVIGVATGGAGLAAGTAAGVGGDIGCEVLTNAVQPDGFAQARGAATAAATAGKCYEVRSHRDSRSGKWITDIWTVTDHQDYCA
jgi:hypothetical protein